MILLFFIIVNAEFNFLIAFLILLLSLQLLNHFSLLFLFDLNRCLYSCPLFQTILHYFCLLSEKMYVKHLAQFLIHNKLKFVMIALIFNVILKACLLAFFRNYWMTYWVFLLVSILNTLQKYVFWILMMFHCLLSLSPEMFIGCHFEDRLIHITLHLNIHYLKIINIILLFYIYIAFSFLFCSLFLFLTSDLIQKWNIIFPKGIPNLGMYFRELTSR